MKLFKNYLKEEFIEDDFLLFLNVVFMILVITFLLILLRKYEILNVNNYKGIIAIITISFIFTYISFEVNCKIINLIKKIKRKW